MANNIIRPAELPPRATPVASEVVPSDNGVSVAAVTWADGVNAGRPLANQVEAEAGVNATKAMTPLTVNQHVTARIGVDLASKAQGDKADTAVQPNELATVATTGDYDDLSNKPTLGTAAATEATDYAPAMQKVPAGGTAGQVLAKASDADNDVVWTASGTGDVLASTIGLVSGLPTDGTTDVRATLVAAQAANNVIRVPAGTYFLSDKIDILDDKLWIFENVTLTHSDATKHFLSAVGKKRFAIIGKLRIQGTRTTTETGAETGLIIQNCEDYFVENVVASGLAGKGFDILGTTAGTYFGAKGVFNNLLAVGCNVGYDIQAGSGAEYGTWGNCSAVNNATGVKMAAGNHIWTGGVVTNNDVGVSLMAGANHLHGSFIGTLINHNTINVSSSDVTLGHLFHGCRFYGGPISLTNSAGIVFEGGVMESVAFTNEGGASAGINYVRGVNMVGTPAANVSGSAPGNLQFVQNYGPGASRILNAPSAHYISMYRDSALQAVSGPTVLKYPVALHNRAGDYDVATGVFTAPVEGLYRVSYTAVFGGMDVSETSTYIDMQADTGSGFTPLSLGLPNKFSTTRLRIIDVAEVRLQAGNKIRLEADGTGVNFGDSAWLSELRIEKIG